MLELVTDIGSANETDWTVLKAYKIWEMYCSKRIDLTLIRHLSLNDQDS
jgi:hypothetical protein